MTVNGVGNETHLSFVIVISECPRFLYTDKGCCNSKLNDHSQRTIPITKIQQGVPILYGDQN